MGAPIVIEGYFNTKIIIHDEATKEAFSNCNVDLRPDCHESEFSARYNRLAILLAAIAMHHPSYLNELAYLSESSGCLKVGWAIEKTHAIKRGNVEKLWRRHCNEDWEVNVPHLHMHNCSRVSNDPDPVTCSSLPRPHRANPCDNPAVEKASLCPYAGEINDEDILCRCCESCRLQCCEDI